MCISYKLPDDVDAAGPRTTLGGVVLKAALLEKESSQLDHMYGTRYLVYYLLCFFP